MAKHYGLDGPRGTAFEKVALSDDRRGGLLAQASFHLLNSNGEDSHPIKRAVWVLDRLLDDPPAPPPPDVPELDPNKEGLVGLSLKQQLAMHRSKAACNDCHRGIDPWGVAFENYDALGIWRTAAKVRQKGKRLKTVAVDSSAELPDGTAVKGPQALRRYLLEKRAPQFARGFVRHLLTYALGRSLEVTDGPFVDKLTDEFIKTGYRIKPLVLAIVDSPAFRTK